MLKKTVKEREVESAGGGGGKTVQNRTDTDECTEQRQQRRQKKQENLDKFGKLKHTHSPSPLQVTPLYYHCR